MTGEAESRNLSRSLERFLAEDPERWTLRRLWKNMPLDLRREALEVVLRVGDLELDEENSPNWPTYDAVMRMSLLYKDRLEELEPRDLVDVHSFSG